MRSKKAKKCEGFGSRDKGRILSQQHEVDWELGSEGKEDRKGVKGERMDGVRR